MLPLTVFIGKCSLLASRLIGRSGSALPGYVIERISPNFLAKSLEQLPNGVILVTGTNGKTTTTKIISELLAAYDLRVLTNRTGSNFVRGIISTIVKHVSFSGRLPYDIAVFEQDEAYAVRFVAQVQPQGVVALNVGRDQMDRFGEIDKTAKLIGEVVETAKDWVVLNANDPRIAEQKNKVKAGRILWFGHDQKLLDQFIRDDQHYSKNRLSYFKASELDVCLKGISATNVEVNIEDIPYKFETKLSGTHNAINITAALTALLAALPDASIDNAQLALANIQPAFGRGERIELKNGSHLRLQLVKNPASFSHALRLLNSEHFGNIGIAINDDYADGRDVSWLWDVDFSPLKDHSLIFCGGTRAFDMAVRLKYDEANTQPPQVKFNKFLRQVLKTSAQNHQPSIIFCTYTSMLKLRNLLKKHAKTMDKEGL